ncbi:MAG: hypothetical protein LBM98_04165 [Oscillospiraceae bacterium]|nr:hypothetical protein [Oscillospiraceae bacterium]
MVQLTDSKYQISETMVWTRGTSCGGNHPAACGRHPSQEGNRLGRGYVGAGFKPALPRKFPSWEGCREAAGWFPRAVRGAGFLTSGSANN